MVSKFSMKMIKILIVTGVLWCTAVTAYAEQTPKQTEVYFAPLQYVFEGKQYTPPEGQQGFIYNGSTYVPLRFISYALDQDVQWDQTSYTVTVQKPDKQAMVSIQEYKMNREIRGELKKADASNLAPTTIPVYLEKVTYVFDGTTKEPSADLPGFIYEDSLYVPIRFFSESLNRQIDWDQETYTVSAVTGDQKPSEQKPEAGTETGSKQSSDSLISAARNQLSSMESSATSSFMSMALSYLSSSNPTEKAAIKAQAEAALAQMDAQVSSITGSLESELKANGYDTSPADAMRKEYADRKAAGRAQLEQLR
ncbi:copper amine oxidase N-terminal domain-containing protein [Paenibacillus sp. MBLB4367]|uniref:copper amine oxidase N-terminal domain-containing protein n=1 Tax=Paenibacillus sp. MBLB4367 TaxID=3384767 RepID=UPI0039083FBB